MSFDAKRLESFDLLRLGLFACNKEGDILYANTAAQFLSGQSLKLLKERKLQYYLNSSGMNGSQITVRIPSLHFWFRTN